jgi:hypothetical protein
MTAAPAMVFALPVVQAARAKRPAMSERAMRDS